MEFVESSSEQRRQLIDAQQVFGAWLPASSDLARMGTLQVTTVKGRKYV